MVLRCERTRDGWTCRAGWNLRLRASGDSAEAAFRRLCFALALDPADFVAERRGDAVRLAARDPSTDGQTGPGFWDSLRDEAAPPPTGGREVLRRIVFPVWARLRAA